MAAQTQLQRLRLALWLMGQERLMRLPLLEHLGRYCKAMVHLRQLG
jgi:hypothetical protein